MANQTFIEVFVGGVPSAGVDVYNYVINKLNTAPNLPSFTAADLHLTANANVTVPANAARLTILTEGAFFFPAGETRHSEKTINRWSQLKTIDPRENATIAVYSFFEIFVIIQVDYD